MRALVPAGAQLPPLACPRPHLSSHSLWPWAASLPGMWERTLTVGSAGKTFSATGWKVSQRGGAEGVAPPCKPLGRRGWPGDPGGGWPGPKEPHPLPVLLVQVGWVLGPDRLLRHLRTVHQNSVFHCPTQAQVRRGRVQPRGGGPKSPGWPDLLVPPPSLGRRRPEL